MSGHRTGYTAHRLCKPILGCPSSASCDHCTRCNVTLHYIISIGAYNGYARDGLCLSLVSEHATLMSSVVPRLPFTAARPQHPENQVVVSLVMFGDAIERNGSRQLLMTVALDHPGPPQQWIVSHFPAAWPHQRTLRAVASHLPQCRHQGSLWLGPCTAEKEGANAINTATARREESQCLH